jgi:hypothetical protein
MILYYRDNYSSKMHYKFIKGKTRKKTNAEIATARSKIFIFCRSALPDIAPKIQDHKADLIKGSQKNR